MRNHLLVLVALTAFLLNPARALPQGGKKKHLDGLTPGGSLASENPNAYFDRATQGKDVWNRAAIADPTKQAKFDHLAEKLGIRNGQITREQFLSLIQHRNEKHAARSLDGPPGTPSGPKPPPSERPAALPWEPGRSWGSGTPPAGEASHKVVVYRSGNLPPGLPDWFVQLDVNQEAQVRLCSWLRAGRSLAEFQKIDRNDDGFLTVDEVLRYQARTKEQGGTTTWDGRTGGDNGDRSPRTGGSMTAGGFTRSPGWRR